jgi:rhomboid protease GluP
MDALVHRLQREFGPRREEPEQTAWRPDQTGFQPGDAEPIPQQSFKIRLPFYTPRAFLALLVINVLIFVIPQLLDLVGVRLSGYRISSVISALGAKDNASIAIDGEYYRFLTAMFLHGGWLHIAFNGYALYSLGGEAERIYGTPRFLLLYFIAGLAGGVASYAFSPWPSVGASGAIFGLIGGLAAFYYASREFLGEIARQQLGSLLTVIMINLFIGFSTPMIDNYAHIGGLLGGAVVGFLLAPRLDLDTRLYPPEARRRNLPLDWLWALGVGLLLALLATLINPPLMRQ